jgi:hypothetical protein
MACCLTAKPIHCDDKLVPARTNACPAAQTCTAGTAEIRFQSDKIAWAVTVHHKLRLQYP